MLEIQRTLQPWTTLHVSPPEDAKDRRLSVTCAEIQRMLLWTNLPIYRLLAYSATTQTAAHQVTGLVIYNVFAVLIWCVMLLFISDRVFTHDLGI